MNTKHVHRFSCKISQTYQKQGQLQKKLTENIVKYPNQGIMSTFQSKKIFVFAAVLGALAVVAGAFGAHGLSSKIPAASLEVWKTGVLYQFIHVFAILALGANHRSNIFWLLGILLFSGSLYVLSTNSLHGLNPSWLGPVTPVGGLLFILGWLAFARKLWQHNAKNGGKA